MTMNYVLVIPIVLTLTGVIFSLVYVVRRLNSYRLFYRAFPEPMVRIDQLGRFIRCNNEFAEILGYLSVERCEAEGQLAMHFPALTLSSLRALTSVTLPHLLTTSQLQNLNGECVPYEVFVTHLQVGLSIDFLLKPIKQQAASLPYGLTTGQEVALVSGSLPDPFTDLVLDESLKVISISSRVKKQFGFRLSIGDPVCQLVSEAYRGRIEEIIIGRRRHARFSLNVPCFTGKDGNLLMNWSFVTQSQNKLAVACYPVPRTNEDWQLLPHLLEGESGYWSYDCLTNNLWQSEAWLQMLDYRSEPTRKPLSFWLLRVNPDDSDTVREAFDSILSGEVNHIRMMYRMATAEGLELSILSIGYVDEKTATGKPANIRGIHLSKLIEEPTENTDLLHDLENQFASISGFAQLINHDSDSKIATYAQHIENSALKASRLVEQSYQDVSGDLFFDLDRLGEHFGVNNIEHRDTSPGFEVMPDTAQQSLSMLLDTALLYGASPRDLTVNTRLNHEDNRYCSHCGGKLDGTYFELKVSINACQLPRNLLSAAFQRGFTVRDVMPVEKNHDGSSHKRLSDIADLSRFVHNEDGHLVMSHIVEPGIAGDELSIFLPLKIPKRARPSAGQSILVVDDDPAVCAYIGEILRRQGYNVTELLNPADAIEKLTSALTPYDLVVSDFSMPAMSGRQLVKKIRQVSPELPIIICSGYSADTGGALVKELEVSGFVGKPVDVDQLLGQVSDCLLEKVS